MRTEYLLPRLISTPRRVGGYGIDSFRPKVARRFAQALREEGFLPWKGYASPREIARPGPASREKRGGGMSEDVASLVNDLLLLSGETSTG